MIDRASVKGRAKGMFLNNYWLNVGLFAVLSAVTGGVSAFSSSGSGTMNLVSAGNGSRHPAISMIVVGAALIFSLIGIAAAIFVAGPLNVSSARAGLNVYDGNRPSFKDVIYAFANGRYWQSVGGMALSTLFIAIPAVVVLVPGVILMMTAMLGVGEYSHMSGASTAAATVAAGIGVLTLAMIPSVIVGEGLSQVPYIIAEEGLSGMAAIRRSWRLMRGHKWEHFVFGLSFFGWSMLAALSFGIVGVFYATPYMSVSMAGYYRELWSGGAAETV